MEKIIPGYKTYIAAAISIFIGLYLIANGKAEMGLLFITQGLSSAGLRNAKD